MPSGSKTVKVTDWNNLVFSWEQISQSVANNTSGIKWSLKLTSGSSGRIHSSAPKAWSVTFAGVTVKGTNYIDIDNNSTLTLASGTMTINHNSDGTKSFTYSFSQAFDITFSGTYIGIKHGSGSGSFTTIPRKSTISVANGTLGTAQTLTVSRNSSSFTHTITATCGSASTTIATKSSSTSINFTPPIEWASQNTTGTSVSVVYTITTYNGSTSLGSNSYTKTCSIPSSVKPSCSVAVTDATGYADKYGGFIKGYSKFKVVVTPTTSYGSAIASYKVTANGSTYTSASFTTGVLNSSGSLAVAATVTDKRDRTGSASVNKTVLDYSAPKVSALNVKRCNSDGTINEEGEYVLVTFSGSVTSLNSKNTAKYVVKYKKSSASSYTSVTLTDYANTYSVSNGTYIFAADTGSSYDVQIAITDDFKTTTRNTSASTAFTLMHFTAGGTGIGIGKVAESENLLDIGVPVKFRAGIISKLLWSGVNYMTASQTATLSEAISKQPTGVVLVFSRYDITNGVAMNEHFNYHFVPKMMVELQSGKGSVFTMSTSNETYAASKYLYISDTAIVGHENNTAVGTGATGVAYNNNRFVLRYVIGV